MRAQAREAGGRESPGHTLSRDLSPGSDLSTPGREKRGDQRS